MDNRVISDIHVEWHEESYEPLWFVVEFPNGEERVIRKLQTQDKPTWVGACVQSRADLLESTDYEDWYNEALRDAHGQGYVLEGEAKDDRPFTVVITESNPPYAPEAVLRLYAESEEDAKRKAAEWILKAHTIFAEEGHISSDDIVEDVEVIDIPS